MINKNLDQITIDDLQTLINDQVIEQKTIEYKQTLPGNSDAEKKEFLADVSSFANSSGGDIIYGIAEDRTTGKPKSLEGLEIENPDREIQRLENIIRTGIQPRIPSIIISKPITIKENNIAIVIRIPKSWISPHRVIYDGHDKFYSRNSSGKYPLDVGELRIAFNLSETITERMRTFRTDRLSKIIAGETPVPLYDNPKIVLHLIPITSFNPNQRYDIDKVPDKNVKLKPIYCHGWNERYNLDGLLYFTWIQQKVSHSYVQLYRNGIIEAVEGLLLEPDEKYRLIPSIAYEEELITSVNSYLSFLKTLGVELPLFIFLNLLGVKGYSMAVNERYFTVSQIIDREILLLPEATIDNYDVNAEIVLRPLFDSIWNACGFPRDLYYNDKGKWSPPR